MNEPRCLEHGLEWGRRAIGNVPLRDVGPGQLIPMIRWEEHGPLLGERRIREFFGAHPDAGLAITLDNSAWGGPRLGCIDDDSGKHDPGDLPRPKPLGGYRESTRSNGTHDLFRYRISLPPDIPSRVTGLGGFIDVLVGGLMYVAPTANVGRGEYRIITGLEAGIPEFDSVSLALDAASPWLKDAWRAKARGVAREGPGATVRADPRPVPADAAEVLARMRESGRGGELAAWIAEHTVGERRDYSLCFVIAGHAAAVGATTDQLRSVLSCPHPEWAPGPTLDRTVARLCGRPPAGIASLLRYPEGRAADEAAPEPTHRPVVRRSEVERFRRHSRRLARPIVDPKLIEKLQGGESRE